ncbi:MAG: tetraacyldisaccharide 4'-kinase, partial [Bacteroidetes bacterium]|nr:tetraacyldisaccharide 4'-kinase [Bacteroidota bacterium]
HIEYLIRLLSQKYAVTTLSRGYGRKTKGFRLVQIEAKATDTGDEPLQIKQKFPLITVTVGENRVKAIEHILDSQTPAQRTKKTIILLDDAFQHRAIKPGLSILLTEYDRPFISDYLLPAGRLREWKNGYKRADIIIITKCPEYLNKNLRGFENLTELHQKIYFSHLVYDVPYAMEDPKNKVNLNKDMDVLLVTGIANLTPLIDYLNQRVNSLKLLKFKDHHLYTIKDLKKILKTFQQLGAKNKICLTTEKDAMRLKIFRAWLKDNNLLIYVLPVKVAFDKEDGNGFDQQVLDYINS